MSQWMCQPKRDMDAAGYRSSTERTTEAVGRATTRAMVICSYAILIGDFILTKTFFLFF